ncbi:MAG: hypothetical protein ACHRXM_08000 [Isosphaerales bacterium]
MAPASTDVMPPYGQCRPRAAIALLVAVLAAHGIQAVRLFPTPRALLDDDHPVILVDHALHLYHGALGSRFLRDHGTTWGYDPFFMAGYPVTPVWDSSSNPSILFQALAGGGYRPRAYNIGLLACSIFALASIPAGAAATGVGLWEIALAALLGWLYFHCGWPDMFWRSGLFGFVTASGGVVLLIGLLLRFERRPGAGRWGAVAGTGAAIWLAHVTAPIPTLGAVLGFSLTTARRHSWRPHAALVAAAVFAVVVNLVWLVPLWRFRGIRSVQSFFMTPTSGWFLIGKYLGADVDSRLGLLILVLGVAGLVTWLREGRRLEAATFGGAALVSLALALFGGQWSVTRTLEPLRFVVPLHLLLAVPAGSALARGTARLVRRFGGRRRGAALATLAWSVALGVAVATMPQMFLVMAGELMVQRPMVAGLRPEMNLLVRWIRENTDPSARILFEDQLRLYEDTDPESTHWTPLLPFLLGRDPRQFIGGEYQMAFILHHQVASFGDFHLGGRPIDLWTPDQLRAYCDLYNVGWVVCWSPLSHFCFDQWGQAHWVATLPRHHSANRPISDNPYVHRALTSRGGPDLADRYIREGEGRYVIYRVSRPHSFILTGEGHVAGVDLNRIELTDLVPSDGAVVLSLHWIDTWRTDPPLPVDPVPIPADPVPLVRISTSQPLKRLVLYNNYGR